MHGAEKRVPVIPDGRPAVFACSERTRRAGQESIENSDPGGRDLSSNFVFRIFLFSLSRLAHAAWRALREWSGDAAYDRYLRVASAKPGAQPPLTPAQFYVEQLNRRYSRPNRCC